MFPGLIIDSLSHASEGAGIFDGWNEFVYFYLIMSLNSLAVCITAYLIARITGKFLASLLLVVTAVFAGIVFVIFLAGFLSGFSSSGENVPENLVSVIMALYFAVTVLLPVIILAVKNRRTDRI